MHGLAVWKVRRRVPVYFCCDFLRLECYWRTVEGVRAIVLVFAFRLAGFSIILCALIGLAFVVSVYLVFVCAHGRFCRGSSVPGQLGPSFF